MPSKLLVTVIEVQNLPKMDLLGKCDPFVRVLLDGVVRQTRTLEKVLQCAFDQDFVLDWGGRDDLLFELYDQNDVRANSLIGSATLRVSEALRCDDVWLDVGAECGGLIRGRNKHVTRLRVSAHALSDEDAAWLTCHAQVLALDARDKIRIPELREELAAYCAALQQVCVCLCVCVCVRERERERVCRERETEREREPYSWTLRCRATGIRTYADVC